MIRQLRQSVKAVLRLRAFAWVSAILVYRGTRLLHDSDDPDALTVLAFSSSRWRQDLAALARPERLRIYAIDDAAVARINDWFLGGELDRSLEYFKETSPAALRARQRHADYAAAVMCWLTRWLKLDCATSCAMHYMKEIPWLLGTQQAGIPFVVVHKEHTVVDERHTPDMKQRWLARGYRFLGTRLCVNSETSRNLFRDAGIARDEQITITGLLRADNLFRELPTPRDTQNAVTLFSFGHLTGPFSDIEAPLDEIRSHYFSKWDHVGFVDLFRDVHVAFAETALRHPDIRFNIKPKNVEPWWIGEIENVIHAALGIPLAEIPNCNIVDRPAPELIAESKATIGLNSTVVLEARIAGSNIILPVFDEAQDKYPNHVYFDRFFDLFAVARSRDELIRMVESAIAGGDLRQGSDKRLRELCCCYLGNADGRSAERVIDVLRSEGAAFAPNRAAGSAALGSASTAPAAGDR